MIFELNKRTMTSMVKC